MKTFVAIIVTVAMKGAPAYKIQFVEGECNKEWAMMLAEKITERAHGKAISVECRVLGKK